MSMQSGLLKMRASLHDHMSHNEDVLADHSDVDNKGDR